MKQENCKKRERNVGTKKIALSIRITEDVSKWMRDNKLSPTGIFYEAIKELGYKKE